MTSPQDFESIYKQLVKGLRTNHRANTTCKTVVEKENLHRESELHQTQKTYESNFADANTKKQTADLLLNNGRDLLKGVHVGEHDATPLKETAKEGISAEQLEQAHRRANAASQSLRYSHQNLLRLRDEIQRRKRAQRQLAMAGAAIISALGIGTFLFTSNAATREEQVKQTATTISMTSIPLTAEAEMRATLEQAGQNTSTAIAMIQATITTPELSIPTPTPPPTLASPLPTKPPFIPRGQPPQTVQVVGVPAQVSITGTVNTVQLNVRRGPGPEYELVDTVRSDDTVVIVGRSADSSWLQIEGTGQHWVIAQFIQVNGNLSQIPVTFSEAGSWGPAGRPTGVRARAPEVVRLRGGPNPNYQQLSNPDTLEAGETVDVVGRNAAGDWLQVNIGNRSAWISAAYVTLSGNGDIPVTSNE